MVVFDKTTRLESLTIPELREVLSRSSAPHGHLCPRQVLGARIGMAGAAALSLNVPRKDKRLLVIVETDGCFVSGVAAATGCGVHRRTLRVEDYGKIAATFIDVKTEGAVRVAPQTDVRVKAQQDLPGEKRYFAMLRAYQTMPMADLLTLTPVRLNTAIGSIISRAGVRIDCSVCGEEIINEREIVRQGKALCSACAGNAYYQTL